MKRKELAKEYQIFNDEDWVRNYDQQAGVMMRYHARRFSSAIKKMWKMTEGKVLDIGTGPGNLAIQLATDFPNFEVIGLDASEEALNVAKENAAKDANNLNVSFIKGNAEKMPFEDKSFDLVVSSFTMHILPNPISMFNEIQRVLKPEGKFLISDFRRGIMGRFMSPIGASYTKKEISQILEQSSLKDWKVQISYFPLMSFLIIHPK